MSIYHINSSFQVDIDVSRAPCDIGNTDVAYAIAICCISTPKVHMRFECHCSHITIADYHLEYYKLFE